MTREDQNGVADRIETILPRLMDLPTGRRNLVALAGPPASGKSTLAASLVTALNRAGRLAALVPMDGFHLDNKILTERGLLDRKGAPETFDLGGFTRLVAALSTRSEVVCPIFDRTRDIAIAGAAVVPSSCEIVVIEGNYLLLDTPGWRDLSAYWNLSVFLKTKADVLRERLVERWIAEGLTVADAAARADQNDMPNAVLILEESISADIVVP
ncbi:MAG: nucleoside/nucleotide kinase family protein [Pseudomonadota bacterium]